MLPTQIKYMTIPNKLTWSLNWNIKCPQIYPKVREKTPIFCPQKYWICHLSTLFNEHKYVGTKYSDSSEKMHHYIENKSSNFLVSLSNYKTTNKWKSFNNLNASSTSQRQIISPFCLFIWCIKYDGVFFFSIYDIKPLWMLFNFIYSVNKLGFCLHTLI